MERIALRELAEGGVLLTSRALAAGWHPRRLSRALRAEGWAQFQNGIWIEPGRSPNLITRLRAAQLVRPRLVVSHRSAAALWRIETLAPAAEGPLECTDPSLTLRRGGAGVRVHRIPIAATEVVERQGLRVTVPGRTLIDLLRDGPRDDAIVAVDSALAYRTVERVRRAPFTRLDSITAALEVPSRGTVRALKWLALCDPRAGSPAETIARLRMHDAGLHPESQAEVHTPDGRRCFIDFLFRAAGLAVEIEGYAYHGTRDSHRRDIARYNQLHQCPEVRRLLRYSAEDVFWRPAHMIGEIRGALAALTTREQGDAITVRG
ncbi:hypothetical protein [Streptomyces olivochromogenes]|uniref:hypothetical protein n=1 Tax=Streptomyces olivochromogenes TaxID=1963 RepID=UPI001F170480|nr:hypothetical protein [Streptomyces olivochromogenes]MCF3131062.1 hypothetical protein [Streptomyces olivochromogenes]